MPAQDQKEELISNQETAYRTRMEKLRDSMLNLQTIAIEAEVLLGDRANEARTNMRELYNDLYKAYLNYFPNAARDIRTGEKHDESVEAARKILFLPVDNDEFGNKVENTIKRAIETFKPDLQCEG